MKPAAILTRDELLKMQAAGDLAARTLLFVDSFIRAGISTEEINKLVHEFALSEGAISGPLGYHGFPKSCCISVNNVVCHGIPGPYDLLDGDIVNVDVTPCLNGYFGDTSATFFIGQPSEEAKKVVEVARKALDIGISVVRAGVRTGDIGAAIQQYVESQGCSVVREYGGHGIGKNMHQGPFVSHWGTRGAGDVLKAGMCITIEPMVNLGQPDIIEMPDGWTIVTEDGSLSAQFEHTLEVTEDGCRVLTARQAKLINSEI